MGLMPATAPFCPSSLPSPPLPLKSYGLGFGGGQRKELRTEPLASTQQGWSSCLAPEKLVPWSIAKDQHKDQTGVGLGLGYTILIQRKVVKWDPWGSDSGSAKVQMAEWKAEAAHALVTIQCGDCTVMMSCLVAPVLTSICFVQGAWTRTPKYTQKCRT